MRPIDNYIMKVPIEINQMCDVKNVPRKYFIECHDAIFEVQKHASSATVHNV